AVHFAGFLDQAGKGREGNAADIYLNTNRVDNSPVSVVEACAMGLPVVATAVGGIPHLVADGHNALLVPDGDHEAMAAAVERLVREPELACQLAARGRTLAQAADWARVRPQWESLISELQ
ncbi:MAG: glycosyltransferase family 4 protein, partial [Gemmatimonadaceae bacterium]